MVCVDFLLGVTCSYILVEGGKVFFSSFFFSSDGQGCVRWRILECLWDSCLLMIAFVFCLASCLGKVSWSGSCQQLGDNRVCVQVSKFSVVNITWY